MHFLPLFLSLCTLGGKGAFHTKGKGGRTGERGTKVPYCSGRRTEEKKRKKGRGMESKKKHWIIGYVFFL